MHNLSDNQIEAFINNGFIKIENAFPKAIAQSCVELLWQEINCSPDDVTTWTQPVIRIGELSHTPFVQASNTAILHAAFDCLVGQDNWTPKTSLGSFPIRFPSTVPANDTGWHVDASFPGDDLYNYFEWKINIHSKGRGLLMLFLFSDVSDYDAPTLLKVGSHFDVAKILAPAGEQGLTFMELANQLDLNNPRQEIAASGLAGTVYLCHPFIVHRAQNHNGNTPKFMAQPALMLKNDFSIYSQKNLLSPVEMAIIKGLEQ